MTQRNSLDLLTILQATAEMADTDGLDSVTLAALARKLGVRSPSLYNHIDGLPGLRLKLTIYGLEQLNRSLTQAAIGRSGDDAVRAIAQAYIAFARAHPGLYAATLSAPLPDQPELKQPAEAIVQLIMRVMQHYGLEEETALHTVRVYRSMLHGFASLEQSNGFGLPLSMDTTIQVLIDTLLAGIHSMRRDPE